jgi:hypothetical protein
LGREEGESKSSYIWRGTPLTLLPKKICLQIPNMLYFVSGDLLYIDVITLEDDHVNVTSCPPGFFINR